MESTERQSGTSSADVRPRLRGATPSVAGGHAPRVAFCASTGRTATMFLAATLDSLPDVNALHEGHVSSDPPIPRLPLINVHNRRSWHDAGYAEQTVVRMRGRDALVAAAGDAALLVDVAYYNSPLLGSLARRHPGSTSIAVFRRCEAFVRSATVVHGEDRQPAGWPDPVKPLTDREKFISLGRLKPTPTSEDGQRWAGWSAVERNIWLWHRVNSHLLHLVRSGTSGAARYEELADDPRAFWSGLLRLLDLASCSNLERCVALSRTRINRRPRYDIGPLATWSDAERAMHERLAIPLENEIYG